MTNIMRRIHRMRATVRSSYRARSTVAASGSVMRAAAARNTVAGSVACRPMSASVSSCGVFTRAEAASRCRRPRRARRSAAVTRRRKVVMRRLRKRGWRKKERWRVRAASASGRCQAGGFVVGAPVSARGQRTTRVPKVIWCPSADRLAAWARPTAPVPRTAIFMRQIGYPRQVGGPRTTPDVVLADKAYSPRAIRRHLLRRGIRAVMGTTCSCCARSRSPCRRRPPP